MDLEGHVRELSEHASATEQRRVDDVILFLSCH